MIKILLAAVIMVILIGFVVSEQKSKKADLEIFSVVTNLDESEEKISEVAKQIKIEKPIVTSSNVLDLSGRRLTTIPSYIFDKTNTQELNLSDNRLDGALQAEIRHLQKLRILNLSSNQFTAVPAEVGQLKNLEILDLSNNQITGLPNELGNLSNLKVLNLKGNDYSSVDLNIIKQGLPASTVIQLD